MVDRLRRVALAAVMTLFLGGAVVGCGASGEPVEQSATEPSVEVRPSDAAGDGGFVEAEFGFTMLPESRWAEDGYVAVSYAVLLSNSSRSDVAWPQVTVTWLDASGDTVELMFGDESARSHNGGLLMPGETGAVSGVIVMRNEPAEMTVDVTGMFLPETATVEAGTCEATVESQEESTALVIDVDLRSTYESLSADIFAVFRDADGRIVGGSPVDASNVTSVPVGDSSGHVINVSLIDVPTGIDDIEVYCVERLCHRQHDQQYSYVLADPGRDGEGVEDLVETEPGGRWVGPFQAVDDSADAVEDTAGEHQDDRGQADSGDELGNEEHRHPAEPDVERGVEPPRCSHPDRAEDDSRDGSDPDDQEHRQLRRAIQSQHGERRVGARDDQVDVRVVHAPQQFISFGRVLTPVVVTGGTEQQGRGRRIDHRGDDGGGIGSQQDQQQSGCHRRGKHRSVQPAAESRFDEFFDRGGHGTLLRYR